MILRLGKLALPTSRRIFWRSTEIWICLGTTTFPIYFAGANAEFPNRSIELFQVSAALTTRSNWRWLRTILAIAALGFASWGLLPESSTPQSSSL